jgi:hypothetical protein
MELNRACVAVVWPGDRVGGVVGITALQVLLRFLVHKPYRIDRWFLLLVSPALVILLQTYA